MLKDIRLSLRQLLKQPAFTAIAVVTIALAIGATTAVLSLVNGLLVRPLPFRDSQRLVLLLQHFKSQDLERIPVSPAEFKDYETRAHSFEKLGAFGGRAEIWKPLAFTDDQMKARSSRSFWIIGRLTPGTSAAQAQAEIETINAQMRREHANNYTQDNSFGGDVLLLQNLAVAGMRPALLILLGAVFLVLLIACANLTTMLLARAAAREREIAIRVALGAGRMRLLKQVFTESVLLALIGGALGVLLALWGAELLKTIGAQTVPRLHEVSVDLVVLGLTLAICVATGIIFALPPGLPT